MTWKTLGRTLACLLLLPSLSIVVQAGQAHGSPKLIAPASAAKDFKALRLPEQLAVKRVLGNGSRMMVVFEDPNCPFCKMFEQKLDQLDDVTVYTFIIPIISSDSVDKTQQILCSPDPAQSWSRWMRNGISPPAARDDCPALAEEALRLAKRLKVNGTPTFVFTDAKTVPGLIPPQQIEEKLAQAAPSRQEPIKDTSGLAGHAADKTGTNGKGSANSYWGLAGPHVYLSYLTRAAQDGRMPDQLPHGVYVSNAMLVTGPSPEAVLAQMDKKYRASNGVATYVDNPDSLRNRNWIGPKDTRFEVLDKHCGAGFVAALTDGTTNGPANVGHAGMGFGRAVAMGCGQDAMTVMRDALADCQQLGACTLTYNTTLTLRIEVAQWDGRKTGALAGGVGMPDVPQANASIGGCGIEVSSASSPPRVGPLSLGSPITERNCRSILSLIR